MKSFQVTSFGQPLTAVEAVTPSPAGTEVLLRVRTCGVCHSDLHVCDGYYDLGENEKIDLSRGVPLPLTLGHEVVGEIIAAGPDAGPVEIGARRVVYPWIGCGKCRLCERGDEHLCARPTMIGLMRNGGFSDHVVVPHPRYLIDFGGLPEAQACTYACSGLTAFGAIKKILPLESDSKILIIGAGGVGLSAIRLIKSYFNHSAIVAEIDESKWKAAQEAGAYQLINPRADGALRDLRRTMGGGVDVVLDFVGAPASFEFGVGALVRSGTLIVVGLYGGKARIAPTLFPVRDLKIIGSTVGSLADMHELMAFAREHEMPPLPVTMKPLDAVNDVLGDLRAGKVVGRAILQP